MRMKKAKKLFVLVVYKNQTKMGNGIHTLIGFLSSHQDS